MPKYLNYLETEYEDLYKCARCCDLDLFLLCNLCSPEGRGYPDISAQAFNFSLIYGNTEYVEDGTIFSVSVCFSLLPAPSSLHRLLPRHSADRKCPDGGRHYLAG